jgi:hypothetical protein
MNTVPSPAVPLAVAVTRIAFFGYFVFVFCALLRNLFPSSDLSYSWLIYLMLVYYVAEQFAQRFLKKGIDLSYAYPILFAIYSLNLVSMALGAQEKLPLLNRAEHFLSFIFIAYVVWTFFLQYLPHDVWRNHRYYTALLVFSITATLGVVNEIVELGLDGLLNTRLIGTDPFDTSLDLLMNSLGSGLFLAVRLILDNKRIPF